MPDNWLKGTLTSAEGITTTAARSETGFRSVYVQGTTDWFWSDFTKGTHDFQYTQAVAVARKDFQYIALYGKLENQIGSEVWFDDLQLRVDGAPNALRSDYNLVQNGSFEWDRPSNGGDGKPDDWSMFYGSLADNGKIEWISGLDTLPAYNQGRMLRIANLSSWATAAALTEAEAKQLHSSAAQIGATVGATGAFTGTMYFDTVRMQQGNVETTYTYDTPGNYLKSMPTGPVNARTDYMRDEQGRAVKSYQWNTASGTVAGVAYYSYDVEGQTKRIRKETTTGSAIVDLKYQYDVLGRLQIETNQLNQQSVTYEYDTTNRLPRETQKDSAGAIVEDITYEYDLLGNRKKKSATKNGSTTTTTYGYNAANEITSINGSSVYLHENGNLTTDGWRTYTYNAENQLIEVKQGTTLIAQYEYDASGLRTKKVAGGKTELYYYSGSSLAYVTDGSNTLKYVFSRTPSGQLLNMVDYTGTTKQIFWYVQNHRGDVVALTDNAGGVLVTYSYDAWGNVTSTGTATMGNGELLRDANPFRYASYQYDTETDFYYLKARYYTPYLGRFLTQDTEEPVETSRQVFGDSRMCVW